MSDVVEPSEGHTKVPILRIQRVGYSIPILVGIEYPTKSFGVMPPSLSPKSVSSTCTHCIVDDTGRLVGHIVLPKGFNIKKN